jgi:hypothetical protein
VSAPTCVEPWPDDGDEIIDGALTAALAYVTPAR